MLHNMPCPWSCSALDRSWDQSMGQLLPGLTPAARSTHQNQVVKAERGWIAFRCSCGTWLLNFRSNWWSAGLGTHNVLLLGGLHGHRTSSLLCRSRVTAVCANKFKPTLTSYLGFLQHCILIIFSLTNSLILINSII